MSARDDILDGVRWSLGRSDGDGAAERVRQRIGEHRRNPIPTRGQDNGAAALKRFIAEAEMVSATIAPVAAEADVPGAVVAYLASHNLPARVAMAPDPSLARIPWSDRPTLEIRRGAAHPDDQVSVTPVFAAIAETGTLMLISGPGTPTTLNLLPDDHIVVLRASQIVGSYEDAWDQLRRARERDGTLDMPRTVNFITGPSRTGDIEQKLVMGAHGPRRLHIVLIEDHG
ncbi:MAG: lactate utilization protein C [Alphaproteobacteria bacterium]|nr:lactate utilization protein C [Alphaproteobacteria bacterium]